MTEYPTKVYCCKACSREARYKKDSSYYDDFPQTLDAEPLLTFECANCGKTVRVYSSFDQRTRFCCGVCARQFNSRRAAQRLAKQHYTSNLGMSGGMSLGSLIRREARSVDKDDGVEIKICPTCGKHFEKHRSNQKYCSAECRYEGWRNGRKSA